MRHAPGRRTTAAVLAAAVVLGGVAAGCSKEPTPGGVTVAPSATLPFTSPSAAEIGAATGLHFPDSVTGFKSVLLSPRQLDVTFTLPNRDVAGFGAASDLSPVSGKRVITHPSPLWELTPSGTFSGIAGRRGTLRLALEVVTTADPVASPDTPAVVRLTVTPA